MGIRAKTGSAEIEVNDNGEKISFYLSDNEFIKKFFDFVDWFSKTCEEIEKVKRSKDFNEDFSGVFEAQKNLSDTALEKLEEMFGDGTCKKIFGIASPTYICVADAIAQLSEEVERLGNEYNKEFMNRYNRRRKGAKS